MKPNLILTNGRIYTQDPENPWLTTLIIDGERILATGGDELVEAYASSATETIDLAGQCLIPGLVDAHAHFQSYALGLRRVDLHNTRSLQHALTVIGNSARERQGTDWLRGRGWSQSEWPDGRFPTADDLDRVVGNRPAYFRDKSGHAAWANSAALRLAGITSATPDPPGGEIQRDSASAPTGILFEKAIELVRQAAPRPTEQEITAAMRQAQERCLAFGLTGIHDYDGRLCFQSLQSLRLADELAIRVVKNIPVKYLEAAIALGLKSGFGDDWLRIGGVKMFADGALGPRTAAMLEPYENEPDNRGIVVTDKEELISHSLAASRNGLSLTIHAIGDRANHDVLDVYEIVRRQEQELVQLGRSNNPSLRHRIEHAQIIHPHDSARFASLGVIASMQPIHATADMEMADRHWADRARYSYAWHTLLDSGVTLVFGSDAPVEPIEPMTGIYAAVTRRRANGDPGPEGWYPDQRLTLAEAIWAYTMGAAITSGRERTMGSITPGKLADLTIFDRDIFALPPDELLDVRVTGTIVGGKLRYRSW